MTEEKRHAWHTTRKASIVETHFCWMRRQVKVSEHQKTEMPKIVSRKPASLLGEKKEDLASTIK